MEIECQSIHTMVYHGSTLDSQINYRLGNKASRKVVLGWFRFPNEERKCYSKVVPKGHLGST